MWPALICLVLAGAGAQARVADEVFRALAAARLDAGVEPLERRAELDEVALHRARQVAAMPHRERLQERRPIGKDVRRAGIEYRRISLHLDLNRGYDDPAAAFVDTWSGSEASWREARSTELDAVGLATARSDDGWVVLAVILLEEPPPPRVFDVRELERLTFEAANDARREHGREALENDPLLVDAARAHTRDMIRRRYFDHVGPDGNDLEDRLRNRGVAYRRIGENLHRNAAFDDPVAVAIGSWLDSPGHRALLLSHEFTRTGLGVAVDEESGTVYFAQVFVEPPEHE